MKTRTIRPRDISQSTSSYPIGGSVLASNSPSFPFIVCAQKPKKNELCPAHPLLVLPNVLLPRTHMPSGAEVTFYSLES